MNNPVKLVKCSLTWPEPLRYALTPTPWGYVALAGRGQLLCRLVLPQDNQADAQHLLLTALAQSPTKNNVPDAPQRDDTFLPELQNDLQQYFAGESASFNVAVDVSWASTFTQAVLAACLTLTPGQTTTYATLARHARRPNAARAVGQVMRNNRVPLIIPCHRVLGATGALVGYSASGGLDAKARLLDHEQSFLNVGSRLQHQVSDK